jgi:DNA-binding NtrC family response regulator
VARAILLVDDEPDLVAVLRDALALSMPAVPTLIATSAAAARAATAPLPDDALALICVDQRLSDGRGTDLLRHLRVRWPHVPALVLTGQRSPALEAEAGALGARVVGKPIRLAAWIGEVQRALGGTG